MDLSALSEEQQNIILNNSGPMLVIAGPGTGKTYTIVKKVIYLLTVEKLKPEEILITTFTNKAAGELKIRIASELVSSGHLIDTSKLKIGTIHSVAKNIVGLKNFIILDDFEQKYLIYKNLKLFSKVQGFSLIERYLEGLKGGVVSKLQTIFNTISENSVKHSELQEVDNKFLNITGEVYSVYLSYLKEQNILDFSQIQSKALELLEKDKDLLEQLKREIKYIIIDEYQDTNNIQNEILLKLCNEQKNICVVGDDDQSIYRFRGAEVKNILNFPYFFEEGVCKVHRLSTNYRSNRDILEFYSKFMKDDVFGKNRHYKELVAYKEGNQISTYKISGENHKDVAKKTGEFIKNMLDNGVINDLSEIAFLFKSTKTAECKALSDEFSKLGLPIFSPRSGALLKKNEVMVVLGLALSLNREYSQTLYKKDREGFPYEAYYKDCIKVFYEYVLENESGILESKGLKEWIKEFRLEESSNFLEIFYKLLKFDDLKNFFVQKHYSDYFQKDSDTQIQQNISQILQLITKYEKKYKSIYSHDFFTDYLPFIMECEINEYEDSELLSLNGHLSFLTFHQSKGLEFPIVFVGTLDFKPKKYERNMILSLLFSEIIESENHNFFESELQDFYRLYYTGFSRAKEFMFLISKDTRGVGDEKEIAPTEIFEEGFDSLPDYTKFFIDNPQSRLGNINEKRGRKLFSYTGDIAIYADCPVRYKFFKVLRFPQKLNQRLLFGQFIHLIIEELHRIYSKYPEIKESDIKKIMRENYNYLKENQGLVLNSEDGKKALEIIKEYSINQFQNFENVVASELSLTLVRDEYILNGVLDIVKKRGELFEIIDLKTNFTGSDVIPENYKKQLFTYKHLAERNGYEVEKLKLHFLGDGYSKVIDLQFDEESILKNIEDDDKIIKKILSEEFYDKIDNIKRCESCDLFQFCRE